MLESLFNKVYGQRAAALLKRDSSTDVLEYSCSPIAIEQHVFFLLY